MVCPEFVDSNSKCPLQTWQEHFTNIICLVIFATLKRLQFPVERFPSIPCRAAALYPTLLHATDAERKNCQPIGAGYGIEWPALDYHLSVEGLIQGLPEAPGLRRMKAGALTPA
jgi:Protein of unknown function (DUF2442)